MNNVLSMQPDGFPRSAERPTPVTEELNRILDLLREAFPDAASISFEFSGKLLVHIDLAKREHVVLVEAMLPGLEGGLFQGINRSATPNRPFFYRVSAAVNA